MKLSTVNPILVIDNEAHSFKSYAYMIYPCSSCSLMKFNCNDSEIQHWGPGTVTEKKLMVLYKEEENNNVQIEEYK